MDAIVIPVYERPAYLKRMLLSIDHVKEYVIFVDDGSKDNEIELLCRSFLKNHSGEYHRFTNAGIAINMFRGIELCSSAHVIITLDSDFIVKPGFAEKLKTLLYENCTVDTIVTGFNATSHPVIKQRNGHAIKNSIGGGNLCFIWGTYMKHIRPNLIDNMWDWRMVNSVQRSGGRFLCTIPSVCQHIGTISSLNHPKADIADDFEGPLETVL